MKSEYKRDMNHNYLILTGEEAIDTNSYQVRMIVANAVPDLLQCRIQGIDGKFMVYYDVTSRHSMTALFEEKKIGMERCFSVWMNPESRIFTIWKIGLCSGSVNWKKKLLYL